MAYPINGTHPIAQECLGGLVVGVLIGCLSQQDIEAPVVSHPIEDVVGVKRALVVDMQLVEVCGILQVVFVTSGLQDVAHAQTSVTVLT